jgi:hypothetical protein
MPMTKVNDEGQAPSAGLRIINTRTVEAAPGRIGRIPRRQAHLFD